MRQFITKYGKVLWIGYVVILLGMSIGFASTMQNDNNYQRGAYIKYPTRHGTVGMDTEIHGNVYAQDEIVKAELIFQPEGIVVPIERVNITHRDQLIRTLSFFKAPVQFTDEGQYDLQVRIHTAKDVYTVNTMSLTVDGDVTTGPFVSFSLEHILGSIAMVIIYVVMILVYKKFPSSRNRWILYWIVAVGTVGTDLIARVLIFANGSFSASSNLPIHMCDISAALALLILFMKDSKARINLYNMMFLWGIGGAAMALVTPELEGYAFPSFIYFNFFIRHGMIVIATLLVTFVDGYRPQIRKLPMTLGISTIMIVIVYGINQALQVIPPYDPGNYMFISYPPIAGSPIDMLAELFGPSPNYIIGLYILASIIYTGLWLPFAIATKLRKSGKSVLLVENA